MPRHSSALNSRMTAQAPRKPSSSQRMEKLHQPIIPSEVVENHTETVEPLATFLPPLGFCLVI